MSFFPRQMIRRVRLKSPARIITIPPKGSSLSNKSLRNVSTVWKAVLEAIVIPSKISVLISFNFLPLSELGLMPLIFFFYIQWKFKCCMNSFSSFQ